MNNLVAIVVRPNEGKSTLFNRLVGMRQAIVDNVSGVTRDRHYGKCEWSGHEFSVVDTGGFTVNSDDVFESAIRSQVLIAIEESDLVIFMVEEMVLVLIIFQLLNQSLKKMSCQIMFIHFI